MIQLKNLNLHFLIMNQLLLSKLHHLVFYILNIFFIFLDLPLLPKTSFVFLNTNNNEIENEPTLKVHGKLSEYKDDKNKSIGILFSGDNTWVGVHLTGSNCIIEPTFCNKGFTFTTRILISQFNSSNIKYILDSGGHGGTSSGVTLSINGNKLYFQVTTLFKTWMVSSFYPYDSLFSVIASWQPESGLFLYINGVLMASEHNGEVLISTQDIDISPNLLIGRNINGQTPKFSQFVISFMTIFDKYFNQQEATIAYLYLSDSSYYIYNFEYNLGKAKAQFNQLRLLNQLERPLKLEVKTNENQPNTVIISKNIQGDILTLIDMNKTISNILLEKHNQIPKNRIVILSAFDAELGTLLYINNQISPVTLSLENNFMDYANVIISAPSNFIYF